MEKEKFKISIIDFMPNYKKVEVGKYEDGSPACLGDCVKHNNEDNWFIVYRYGKIMLKQVGMMAMIGQENFDKGDFSRVGKTNIFGAGNDWLIIGYTDEPMYKDIFEKLL
ncbi:MAG: hypothetical protein V4666_08430 [Bacteroidota bacterium]